jgi:hypothetical protein
MVCAVRIHPPRMPVLWTPRPCAKRAGIKEASRQAGEVNWTKDYLFAPCAIVDGMERKT